METTMTNEVPKNGLNGHVGHTEFLHQIFQLLMEEGIRKGTDTKSKVVEFVHPAELQSRLDLDLEDAGATNDRLMEMCLQTLRYSVKTGHPHFFNQLYQGLNHYSLAGSWLTDTVNTSQYTYEVAPVFTLMENVVLRKLQDLVQYKTADGTFCPGGSISNMYGLNLARFYKFPEVKTDGMQSLPKLCIFASSHAHYSIKKGASLLGLGTANVRIVPCNDQGQMNVERLEEMVNEAKKEEVTPFVVVATSGTTVAGAYDPLDAIADVCTRHAMWLHVDACWGGGALFSEKHKHLLQGIDRSDSLAWNPHKMMTSPLQCCIFLTKHEGLLSECHCANARYLFQQDKFYDMSYDTGDKSIQCGRRVDAFKLWLMWKAMGTKGFEKGIDNIFENARYLTERIRKHSSFILVYPDPQCTNVCFWYVPPSMQQQQQTTEWWQKLGKVAPAIKERMILEGTMMIGYQPMEEKVNFFRLVVCNHDSTKTEMNFVISEIERLGSDLG